MEKKYIYFMELVTAKERKKILLWALKFSSNMLYKLFIPAVIYDKKIYRSVY
jgi:hypothetical protein